MVLLLLAGMIGACEAGSGKAGHENVLLGMHFAHNQRDCNTRGDGMLNVVPGFWDYVKYMPEDLEHMSYIDFWHWWYEFERYKGDEKGLAEMDAIFDECLRRGMKVKIDLAWSTWWTHDKDWQTHTNMAIGPSDLDDWVHLCDLLGRRYRGKVAVWLLQGEANDLTNYWQGAPIEHVHEVYKLGSRAFKRVDQGTMISVAGASPSVSKEALDEWTRSNLTACKGLYDDVPMNYFGDVADPYGGLMNYYNSIRSILDELGEYEVEIGSGESSFQWAETSHNLPKDPPTSMEGFDPAKTPLCELKQAWRCNESLGTFFDAGGTKFVMWGTEYAPGGGWAWRWGLRKYQDWWGNWPESDKIPGTNIVFGSNPPDGSRVDLRPGWTSAQTDPYHPMWEVFKYWAQATPPGSEAVRIGMAAESSGPRVLRLASYLRTRDRCIGLIQNDERTAIAVRIDTGKTGWTEGTSVAVTLRNEAINYATGDRATLWTESRKAIVRGGALELNLPALNGFTTIEIERDRPALDAECAGQRPPKQALVGKPIECVVAVRNTGASPWPADTALVTADRPDGQWAIGRKVEPGETAAVVVRLPAEEAPGSVAHFLRLRSGDREFGPAICVSARVSDPDAPRKLVAFREVGHVRLKWFAPEQPNGIKHYELQRSDGFDKPFQALAEVSDTSYVDSDLEKDRAYYYRVAAVRNDGSRSRPSNEDNAKAISQPRLWDAEIVSHTVPSAMRLGELSTAEVTIRNTGSKPWDSSGKDGAEVRFRLDTVQQWGCDDESILPRIAIDEKRVVNPGETVTLTVPYVGMRAGRFENHWVLCLEVVGKSRAYFGTPLLVETVVTTGR